MLIDITLFRIYFSMSLPFFFKCARISIAELFEARAHTHTQADFQGDKDIEVPLQLFFVSCHLKY